KAWNQIQDGHAQTSAGQAVGFLFIPFFNLYWIFVALYGLAVDMHRYVVRRRLFGRYGLDPFPVAPALALTCCILMVCIIVPLLPFATVPVSLVLMMVLMGSVARGSAGIAEARLQQEGWGQGAALPLPPHPAELPPLPAVPMPHAEPRGSDQVQRLAGP